MKRPKVAVVGAGLMGRNHARVYSEMAGVELAGISDVKVNDSRALAERYRVPFYEDYLEMVRKEGITMATVAVPTNFHFKVASDLIKAGVHVLIEKPIASKVAEAEELVRLAKKHKVVLAVGHIERFNSAVIELKKRIQSGQIGEVFKISASRLSPFPMRIEDMGVIIDLAVHDMDIFLHLLESEVVDVHAAAERRLHRKFEDICVAIFRFKNGVIGVLNIDRLTPVAVRKLTVTGSRGMFELDYLLQDLYWHKNSAVDDTIDYTQHVMGVTVGDMIKIRIDKKEPLRNELESFVQAVVNGSKPMVTGEDGVRVLKLAHRVLESAREK